MTASDTLPASPTRAYGSSIRIKLYLYCLRRASAESPRASRDRPDQRLAAASNMATSSSQHLLLISRAKRCRLARPMAGYYCANYELLVAYILVGVEDTAVLRTATEPAVAK